MLLSHAECWVCRVQYELEAQSCLLALKEEADKMTFKQNKQRGKAFMDI